MYCKFRPIKQLRQCVNYIISKIYVTRVYKFYCSYRMTQIESCYKITFLLLFNLGHVRQNYLQYFEVGSNAYTLLFILCNTQMLLKDGC